MDPASIANMLNNPEMMRNMEEMMKRPEFQSLLNNKDLMSNMMNMFSNNGLGNPTADNNSDDITSVDDSEESLNLKDKVVEQHENIENEELNSLNVLYSINDLVEIHNLKNDKYNGCTGTINKYEIDKKRYVINLEYENKPVLLLIKEENLKLKDVNLDDLDDLANDEAVLEVN